MILDLGRWPDGDRLLDEALALSPDERLAYIDRVAAHDPQLRNALETVVAEVGRDDGFLDPGGALTGRLGDDISATLNDGPDDLAVAIDSRIGRYEIISLLGRGGMGEVYRARDPRLQRDVALKVLPATFAADGERAARFRREARVLASLNHPGIGAIYGMVEEPGLQALVLEFVHGATLAQRLESGPIPVIEALAFARQLAEAIEAAHDAGVLHRDLKPANIMVNGAELKVLDFGLGKPMAPRPGDTDVHRITALMPGLLLGTAPYMSPEQARGQPADARADVWAFGCVLFEMLTGVRAFRGKSAPEVLAMVMNRDPAFDRVPADTPPSAVRLLRRTLAKDRRQRVGCMHDVRLDVEAAIREAAERDVVTAAPPTGATALMAAPARPRRFPRIALWLSGIAAAAAVAAGAAIAVGDLSPLRNRATPASKSAPPAVIRFEIVLPPGQMLTAGVEPVAALSADGQTLVYAARDGGVQRLFRRDMRALQPQPIPGTEGGAAPFLSPDGQWVAFAAGGMLRRVPLGGGTPTDLAPASGDVTGVWTTRNEVVFSSTSSRALAIVSVADGRPVPLTTLDASRGDTWHLMPQELPGGRFLLFTLARGQAHQVAVLDRETGDIQIITEGSGGRYVGAGALVFWRDGSLWASPFDLAARSLTGMPIRLDEVIAQSPDQLVHFDVAADGSLVFLPEGTVALTPQPLTWVDRTGRTERARIDPHSYVGVSASPDGTRLAVAIREQSGSDIWIADSARGTLVQLTTGPARDTDPVWTPDGTAVIFQSQAAGRELFMRDAQGARPAAQITTTGGTVRGRHAVSPVDGTVVFSTGNAILAQGLPTGRARTLFESPSQVINPQPSPDGRWLAYQSDRTGRPEVYVRAAATPGDSAVRVSTGGGSSPRWSENGRELFYLGADALMAVPVNGAAGPDARAATPLFSFTAIGSRRPVDYDIARETNRFVFILEGATPTDARQSLVVVRNWSHEVTARLTRSPAAPAATP